VLSIYENFPNIKTIFCEDEIPKDINFGTEIHLDLETTGLNFGVYHPEDDRDSINIIGIGYDPLADGRFTKALVCQVKKGKEVPGLKKLLENEQLTTYIHHAAFDAPALFDHYSIIPSNVKCTKTLSKLLGRANNRYSDLVKSICGLELPKGMLSTSNWALPFSEWSDEMKKYCVYDVVYGKWIHDYLFKLCDTKKRKLYKDLSNSWPYLIRALNLSSKKGILAI
jgi:hypothetical protein